MNLDYAAIGAYLQNRRRLHGLTQAELGERLMVSAQAVSHWERGESLPDAALLPDLARILQTSVDELLGGGSCAWLGRRRITVEMMREAIWCVQRLRLLLGADHFMYRAAVEGLDQRMNSRIEAAFADEGALDAYVCEALMECVRHGDYVDAGDVRAHIASAGPRQFTLDFLQKRGEKASRLHSEAEALNEEA